MTKRRNLIVHIAASADGYIAGPDGDLEWLTSRPAPKGFHGMSAFMKSIDTKLLGRKTYDVSLRMGARFDSQTRNVVFSRHAPPATEPCHLMMPRCERHGRRIGHGKPPNPQSWRLPGRPHPS